MNVLIASVVLGVAFLGMGIYNINRYQKVSKRDKKEVKPKIYLYSFGVLFCTAMAFWAYIETY